MRVITCEQRSAEWYEARLGRLGSSSVADIYSTRKDGNETAARRDLRMKLALERVTGKVIEASFSNADMARGVELEPAAVAVYEADRGVFVEPCGYIQHDELLAGYSPDGLVAPDGLIEVKCPRAATHLRYLTADRLPDDYLHQCRHGLWLSGRAWIDFVSYCPEMPDELQLFVKRAYALDLDLPGHEKAVRTFLEGVDKEVALINEIKEKRRAA